MPRVECPKCSAWLAVDEDAIGELTECRYCHAVFPAVDLVNAPEPDLRTGIARFLADIYEPADPEERAWLIREAERQVKAPATGLIVTGLTGIAATLVIGLVVVVNDLDHPRPRPMPVFQDLGITVAVAFYFFLLAAGGRSLRRLEHPALCSLSASLGIVGFACCGIYAILTVTGFIFGTWTFVALRSREVRHAMRWKQQEREQRRW